MPHHSYFAYFEASRTYTTPRPPVKRPAEITSDYFAPVRFRLFLFELAYTAQHLLSRTRGVQGNRRSPHPQYRNRHVALAATFTPLMQEIWREECVAVCAALMVSTTAIGVASGTFEPLFVSIVAIGGCGRDLGAVGSRLAGLDRLDRDRLLLCFSKRSGRIFDPHAFMHWLGLFHRRGAGASQHAAAKELSATDRGKRSRPSRRIIVRCMTR